ncbi:MAG: hypothetical protein KatS3mg119_0485 [Rhodothalassiaceae bacterium]|nr:MAG: hypothetical protein KatS3mg119_0485 [Rhodothalassiaceae bacterium]
MGEVVRMTAQAAAAGERPEFGAFLREEADCALLREAAAGFGLDPQAVTTGDIADAVRRFAARPAPRFLVVELDEERDPIADLSALAEACGGDTWVLAVGSVNDVQHYRRLLAAGVVDYLVRPLQRETLVEAIEHLLAAMAEAAAAGTEEAGGGRKGRHIAVVPVRPGAGASLVAASLALRMSEHAGRTALVDLDIHFGTAALQFDLEPGRGLIDALANPDRIDALLLERAALKVSERLAVFSAEAPLDAAFDPPGEAVLALIAVLETLHPHLVLDMPVGLLLGAAGAEIVSGLDEIVVVAEPTLAHVRDTIRLIARLEQLGARRKPGGGADGGQGPRLKLLLNKVPAGGPVEVRAKDFAASVERPVDAVLPFDPKAAVAAAQEARPVIAVAPRSPLGRALAEAFGDILAGESEAARGGVLQRLFGR